MADDVTTLSNPLITPVEQEELEVTLLDVIVSQRPHEEEPPKRVVRLESIIQHGIVDCLLTHML
jgi:hypothetical protein